MAAPIITTHKALTYGQMADRYGFTLTDTSKQDVYMPWDPLSIDEYPFSSSVSSPANIGYWKKPSHTQTKDLVTEDFEYSDDYIHIGIPSAMSIYNTRTFNAYLIHSSWYDEFEKNYKNLTTEDKNKLKISVPTQDFGECYIQLEKMYWYKDGEISRAYTKANSYTTMYVVSTDDTLTKLSTVLRNKMMGSYDLDFGNDYNKFFTQSNQALSPSL